MNSRQILLLKLPIDAFKNIFLFEVRNKFNKYQICKFSSKLMKNLKPGSNY